MKIRQDWVVYLVQCTDDSLYCGSTNNLNIRLAAHNSGKGAKYTRSRRPVHLVGVSAAMTKSEALKLEHRVKHVPAAKKKKELTMAAGAGTMDAKRELVDIQKELRLLSRKIEKLILYVEKLQRRHLPI